MEIETQNPQEIQKIALRALEDYRSELEEEEEEEKQRKKTKTKGKGKKVTSSIIQLRSLCHNPPKRSIQRMNTATFHPSLVAESDER